MTRHEWNERKKGEAHDSSCAENLRSRKFYLSQPESHDPLMSSRDNSTLSPTNHLRIDDSEASRDPVNSDSTLQEDHLLMNISNEVVETSATPSKRVTISDDVLISFYDCESDIAIDDLDEAGQQGSSTPRQKNPYVMEFLVDDSIRDPTYAPRQVRTKRAKPINNREPYELRSRSTAESTINNDASDEGQERQAPSVQITQDQPTRLITGSDSIDEAADEDTLINFNDSGVMLFSLRRCFLTLRSPLSSTQALR